MQTNGSTLCVCERCGSPFYTNPARAAKVRFCSRACYFAAAVMGPRATGKMLTCEVCGTSFYRQRNRVESSRFCGHACYHASKKGVSPRPVDPSKRETKPCLECGKLFASWAARDRKFCRYVCSVAYKRAHQPDRFWSHVNKQGPVLRPDLSPCWVWTGSLFPNGYGQCGVGMKGSQLTHRVAWELTNGPIPDNMQVCHHCDNRPCVRPEHLFLGDNSANMRDMISKGRRDYAQKLTPDTVRVIRAEYAHNHATQRRIAERYGVDPMTIRDVGTRRTWKHVA